MTAKTSVQMDFSSLLLGTLGHTDDEFTSLLYFKPGSDAPHTAVLSPADALDAAGKLPPAANCFFGVNPVKGPARKHSGKGKEVDVTRLAGLFADLDVKPGACPTLDVARAIVAELGIILGTRPSVIVYSGGGLQPYWPVLDGDDPVAARPILKRWGRLVAVVAEKLGCNVDNVYNLDRVLRLPGTFNHKTGQPRPVTAELDTGGPLELAEIAERLDEVGIFERPEDTEDTDQTEVSTPDEWHWAASTCPYVAKMVAGFRTDTPKIGTGRSPWLISCKVRLNCAKRLGCITEADYRQAEANLEARFAEILADSRIDTPRQVKKYEHRDTKRAGVKRAAAKTDDQCRAELGGHTHNVEEIENLDDSPEIGTTGGISTAVKVTHSGHLGMAYKLGVQFRDKLLYVHGIGWHRWDGKRWAKDDNGAARRAVHQVIRREWIACAKLPAEERDDRAKQISRYESASAISGILTEAAALEVFAVTVNDLDADPYLLNCANGTLDLHTVTLRPASPADRITKVCRGAYTHNSAATVWHGFLDKSLPDQSVRQFVQRLAGLALLGEVREHLLPIFTGEGANGKSTFYEGVLHTLGDYGIVAEADLFNHRENAHPTGQMDLMGRRLAVVSETDEGKRLAEATVKRLTGGDPIRARFMRENFVQFQPSHLPILVTNHLPKVSGDDPAIWRRIRVVDWTVVIPAAEQDKELARKLQLEADGILSWAVDGLRAYLDGGLAEPDSVVRSTSQYRADSDSVGRFIAEECHQAEAVKINFTDLFEAWEKWRRIEGAPEVTRKALGMALSRLGFQSKPSNGKTWWHGLTVLGEAEQWR